MTFAVPSLSHIILYVPANRHRASPDLRALAVGEARPEAGAARVGVARPGILAMASPMSDVFLHLRLSVEVAAGLWCAVESARGGCGSRRGRTARRTDDVRVFSDVGTLDVGRR